MALCSNSLFLMSGGSVKGVGENDNGQLGLGNTVSPITTVSDVPIIGIVKQIACGLGSTMFLMSDGSVKCVGRNSEGQLGLGDKTSPVTTISNVPIIGIVKQIACGAYHTMFLMNDGSVKSTGYNSSGQLGLGNNTSPITTVSDVVITGEVKQIACGTFHTMFLMSDGSVKCVGANSEGQLGLGNNTSPVTTISDVPITGEVKQIACGGNHTMFLMSDGSVKCTGSNGYGQLGLGNTTSPITAVSDVSIIGEVKQITCGTYHTIFLMNNGSIKGVGMNSDGQLGLGNTVSPITTISNVSIIGEVKQITCGGNHTMFLMSDGSVKSVGNNTVGQLGLENTTTPITTISNVTIAGTVISLFELLIIETALLLLLKENNQYYSILEEYYDTVNKVYTPISSLDFDAQSFNFDNLFTETTIEDETFIPFDKFSAPSIVSNSPFVTLQINGIKSNSQLVVANGDILLENVFNIDSFTVDTNIVGDGDIKLAVSIDSGNTWLTFNDVASEFSLLENVTTPLKAFEEMSEEEIIQWNDAATSIANSGIDFTDFNTLNFNSLKNDLGATTIRFAYVLTRYALEDISEVDKLEWQFDVLGYFRKMKDSEYDVDVYSDAIEVKSLIDSDIIKINYIT